MHFQLLPGHFGDEQLCHAIRTLAARRVRVLLTSHTTPERVSSALAEAIALADRVLVHSPTGARVLAAWTTCRQPVLFPHGFPAVDLARLGDVRGALRIAGNPVVSSCGFLEPRRGLRNLIGAMDMLRAERRPLLVTCNAPAKSSASYRYLADCLGAIDRLRLWQTCRPISDFLSPAEMVALMSASDVVVLPYEGGPAGSSGAVRLALASGRPVITSRHPIFEDVADEVFQIEDASPPSIARAIATLVDDRDRREDLVARARRRVARDSRANVAGQYAALIRTVCGALDPATQVPPGSGVP